jgi:hypothetical protein
MKNNNPTEEDIKDHLETYSPILEEINKTKVYQPSFLFSRQERIQRFVSKSINQDNDILDGEEQLKEIMKYVCYIVGGVVIVTLILVSV